MMSVFKKRRTLLLLDVVEGGVPERVVYTRVRESAAAELREGRDLTRCNEHTYQTLVLNTPDTYHVARNTFFNPARQPAVSDPVPPNESSYNGGATRHKVITRE
jgi:hypothetical protein